MPHHLTWAVLFWIWNLYTDYLHIMKAQYPKKYSLCFHILKMVQVIQVFLIFTSNLYILIPKPLIWFIVRLEIIV